MALFSLQFRAVPAAAGSLLIVYLYIVFVLKYNLIYYEFLKTVQLSTL